MPQQQLWCGPGARLKSGIVADDTKTVRCHVRHLPEARTTVPAVLHGILQAATQYRGLQEFIRGITLNSGLRGQE